MLLAGSLGGLAIWGITYLIYRYSLRLYFTLTEVRNAVNQE